MKRTFIGLVAFGALAVTAVLGASAQDGGRGEPDGPFDRGRRGPPTMSPGDREAFVEARIAGMKAGLRLTPEQEKMWPPVEEAMRGLARQRSEARAARRERWASIRESDEIDIPGQLRFMADRQAASSEALRRLADASTPLYRTLDDGQRRRLRFLARFMGTRGGLRHRGWRDGHLGQGGPEAGMRDFAAAERGGRSAPPR